MYIVHRSPQTLFIRIFPSVFLAIGSLKAPIMRIEEKFMSKFQLKDLQYFFQKKDIKKNIKILKFKRSKDATRSFEDFKDV